MRREKKNRKFVYLIGRIFKRQKVPDEEMKIAEMTEKDILDIVPIVCVEPITVPERFKVEEEKEPKEEKRQIQQQKENIADRFVVKTVELDEIGNIINGH